MQLPLWAITLVATSAIAAGAALISVAADMPSLDSLVAATFALFAGGAALLLVLVRFARLPGWGRSAMRVFCTAPPLLWLLGSLDSGGFSGQEVLSLVLVAALYWGIWRVFWLSLSAAAFAL